MQSFMHDHDYIQNLKHKQSLAINMHFHICQQILIYLISHLLKMLYTTLYDFNITLKANINLTTQWRINRTRPVYQVLICLIRFIIYGRLSSKAANTEPALIFIPRTAFIVVQREVRLKWFISVPTPSVQNERWKPREKHTNDSWTSALWGTHTHTHIHTHTHTLTRLSEGQNSVHSQ